MKVQKTAIAAAVTAAVGIGATAMAPAVSAATLADGFYDMVIASTPYVKALGGYLFGTDGAWASGFTFGCLPDTKGCGSNGLYDDTVASPVNGRYSGTPNDGRQGTVGISVTSGTITGTGTPSFDMIPKTAGGSFAEYGSPTVSGSITAGGAISLTLTDLSGTVGDFPTLVDEAWNVDDFNGGTGTPGTTNFVPNPPNTNTAYDSFSTGTATNGAGSVNGAAYDGTTAILVKGGQVGSVWGGFFGANYFEFWNVSFVSTGPPIPVPAAVWLFGSGLIGLVGVARRKKSA